MAKLKFQQPFKFFYYFFSILKTVLLHIFVETFFLGGGGEGWKQSWKEQHLLELEIFVIL